MSRSLARDRVEALFQEFERGRSIKATARLTGAAPKTVRRYRRIWCAAPLCISLSADRRQVLGRTAASSGIAPSKLAAKVLEVVIDDRLLDTVMRFGGLL